MTLNEYIEKTGESLNAVAKRAGVTPSVVYRYATGQQKSIKPHIAQAISKATGGKVTVLDLLFPGVRLSIQVEVDEEGSE